MVFMGYKVYIIACCLCICTNTTFAQTKVRTVSNRCSFVEEETIKDKDFWFPENQSMSLLSVVNDTKSAALLTYVYVSNLFGEKIAKIEQPYHISIVNDSLWMVSGTSRPRNKKKQWKGNFYLLINKFNGKIISCMHDK
jgi:hypothetical protein